MSSSPLPALIDRLTFPASYTNDDDERCVPESTVPEPLTDNPPPKKSSPLASRKPAKFYSQYKCPICHAIIAKAGDADFIGHAPCLHRGTCTRSSCILAYYGTSRKWGGALSKPKKSKQLFCQADGCGKEIEEWCHVKAVTSRQAGRVMALPQKDPAVEKAEKKARAKTLEKEMAMRRKEERMERKKKEKLEKENRRPLIEDRFDCFLATAIVCGTLCCCSPLICLGSALS